MNTGAFGENFPYVNFHDLNLDWIIKTLQEIRQQVIDGEKEIKEAKKEIEDFIADIGVQIDSLVEQAIEEAIESGDFAEIIAAVANQNIYYCVNPTMTQQTIQNAINEHTAIKFTSGTYRVYIPEIGDYGYSIPSNRIIFFDDATIIKIGNYGHEHDTVLQIDNAENIYIFGNGTINYNREMMQVASGEHGMCCSINNSTNISIDGLRFINAYGDGLYLNGNNRVYINNILCNNNRRNAISVISGANYFIENSIFSNSYGTAPEAGIAVENNIGTDYLYNINFTNCKCFGNNSEYDTYARISSNNASITFNNIEAEIPTNVHLIGTNNTVIIRNSKFATKSTLPIFKMETGSNNYILFQNCTIDASNNALCLIDYSGSVFENVYIIDSFINNGTLTDRCVTARGSRAEVGNIHVKMITNNLSIPTPVMILQTARTNPVIEWSLENNDYKELPADTVLVFNNYYITSNTRIGRSFDWLKQKIRIKNSTSNNLNISGMSCYTPYSEASSLTIPAGYYTEIQWMGNGLYALISDSTPLTTRLSNMDQEIQNTIRKVQTITVNANSSANLTLPSDGQYILCGYGSTVIMNNIMFLIGGYATASRCNVTSLTQQGTVTIDNSNTTSLTFIISNSATNNNANLVLYKLV